MSPKVISTTSAESGRETPANTRSVTDLLSKYAHEDLTVTANELNDDAIALGLGKSGDGWPGNGANKAAKLQAINDRLEEIKKNDKISDRAQDFSAAVHHAIAEKETPLGTFTIGPTEVVISFDAEGAWRTFCSENPDLITTGEGTHTQKARPIQGLSVQTAVIRSKTATAESNITAQARTGTANILRGKSPLTFEELMTSDGLLAVQDIDLFLKDLTDGQPEWHNFGIHYAEGAKRVAEFSIWTIVDTEQQPSTEKNIGVLFPPFYDRESGDINSASYQSLEKALRLFAFPHGRGKSVVKKDKPKYATPAQQKHYADLFAWQANCLLRLNLLDFARFKSEKNPRGVKASQVAKLKLGSKKQKVYPGEIIEYLLSDGDISVKDSRVNVNPHTFHTHSRTLRALKDEERAERRRCKAEGTRFVWSKLEGRRVPLTTSLAHELKPEHIRDLLHAHCGVGKSLADMFLREKRTTVPGAPGVTNAPYALGNDRGQPIIGEHSNANDRAVKDTLLELRENAVVWPISEIVGSSEVWNYTDAKGKVRQLKESGIITESNFSWNITLGSSEDKVTKFPSVEIYAYSDEELRIRHDAFARKRKNRARNHNRSRAIREKEQVAKHENRKKNSRSNRNKKPNRKKGRR